LPHGGSRPLPISGGHLVWLWRSPCGQDSARIRFSEPPLLGIPGSGFGAHDTKSIAAGGRPAGLQGRYVSTLHSPGRRYGGNDTPIPTWPHRWDTLKAPAHAVPTPAPYQKTPPIPRGRECLTQQAQTPPQPPRLRSAPRAQARPLHQAASTSTACHNDPTQSEAHPRETCSTASQETACQPHHRALLEHRRHANAGPA